MNLLKNNKGFTLTELIVSMLILSVITVSVSAVFAPVLKTYEQANNLAERNTLLNNAANQIIGDLSEASRPLDVPAHNDITITIDGQDDIIYSRGSDGTLLKNGVSVLSKNYYKKKSVDFDLAQAPGTGEAYILTVTVTSDGGGGSISRNYAVTPLILNQYPSQ